MAPKGPKVKKQVLAAVNTIAKKRGGQASSLESELSATGSEKSMEKKPLKMVNPKAKVNEKGDASENNVEFEFERKKNIIDETYIKVEEEDDEKNNFQATKTKKTKGKKVKETELTPKTVKPPKPRGKRVISKELAHIENANSSDENENPEKVDDKVIPAKTPIKGKTDTKENLKLKPKSKKIAKSISEHEVAINSLGTVQNSTSSKKGQEDGLYENIEPTSSKTKQKPKAKPESKAKSEGKVKPEGKTKPEAKAKPVKAKPEAKANSKGKKAQISLNDEVQKSVVDAIKEEHFDEEDNSDEIENKPMEPKVQAKTRGKKQVSKTESKKNKIDELNDEESRIKTEVDDTSVLKSEKNRKHTQTLLKTPSAQAEASKKLPRKPVNRSKKAAKSQDINLSDEQNDGDISSKPSKSMMKSEVTSESLDDPPMLEDAEAAKPKTKRKLMNIEKPTSMPKKKEVKGKRKQVENASEDTEEEVEPDAKKLKNTKVKGDDAQNEEAKEGPAKTKRQPKKEKVAPAEQGEGDAEGPTKKKKKSKEEKETKEKPALKNKASTDYEDIDFSNATKDAKGNQWNFKIASWNVDGVRAWLTKCGLDYMKYEKPDILCLQEVKCSDDKLPLQVKEVPGYHAYWLCSEKDGYAGVGIYSKDLAIHVDYGLGDPDLDTEGRIITAEFENFYLICTYVPNAGRKLVTLPRRLVWNEAFRNHVKELDAKKPVIICGDMNVAHKEIDLANPKTNKRNAGFTEEERAGMTDLLGDGLVDTYRHFYPNTAGAYTFWTYMLGSRAKNVGWRLDYFLVSERLMPSVCDSLIRSEVFGSDHCPIALFLHLNSADQPQATHK